MPVKSPLATRKSYEQESPSLAEILRRGPKPQKRLGFQVEPMNLVAIASTLAAVNS